MEPSKETISVRVSRLNNQILNKIASTKDKEKANFLTRDTLLDAIQVLYDECNTENLKTNDKNIAAFVDRFRRVVIELKQLRVSLNDFEVKNIIGRGHFGDVNLVKEKQTGDVYAMKTIRKYENLEHKCAQYDEERNIMAMATSTWITKLQYAFQDSTNLYFIMEYHPGGDLYGLLCRQGGTIPESAAIFYLAELTIAINDLHGMGFIHKDVKPDNILLDRCGHLKLADFGSASKLNAKRGNPVGTPDYIAPEALQALDNKNIKLSTNCGKACDFWSIGIIAYELTIGVTPFKGQTTTATYSKVMNFTKHLRFPQDVLLTQAYIDLIKNLLIDAKQRLSYTPITNHVLFKNIDFTTIRDQVPPFVPKITCADDTSNFSDIQVKKKQPHMDNFKPKSQFNGRNLPFIGFTFTVEPKEYKETYRRSSIVKDTATVDHLRKEISSLERKVLQQESSLKEKEGLDKKLEEFTRKLSSLESVRDSLERDLANSIAESQALKRTLDLERKDRSDLERKALDLIKGAKLKWEASEKIKLDSFSKELNEAREKNEKLINNINQLNEQLRNAMQVSNKHKTSLENIEKLRRSSIIGLESRLDRVTSENQAKITTLQSQLAEEIKMKEDLQRQAVLLKENEMKMKHNIDSSTKQLNELKAQCVDYEAIINNLKLQIDGKTNDLEQYKRVIHVLEEEIEASKVNDKDRELLQEEQENNRVLQKQIKDLKAELNTMRTSKLNSLEDVKHKYETKLSNMSEELKKLRVERNDLELKNREVNLSMQSKEEKLKTLEELLNKLQSDLSKLENGSEREMVLQEQVERLEQQVIETSEHAAVEKQEFNQFKTRFWRLEKDLVNADLDKKIVERDLKEEKERNKELVKEIELLNDKTLLAKKSHESAISELGIFNDKLESELIKTREELKRTESALNHAKSTCEKSDAEIVKLRSEFDSKSDKISNILEMLDKSKAECAVKQAAMDNQEDEIAKLQKSLLDKNNEIGALKAELEQRMSEINNNHLNRNTMREAIVLLENQLNEFESVLEYSETKRVELQEMLKTSQAELATIKDQLKTAKKATNEEKSLKLLTETKCKRLKDDIEHLYKELESYKNECEDFKKCSNELSDELTVSEQRLSEYEVAIKSYERQIEKFIVENTYLKEENSEQLTYINNMKESNYKLGKCVNEAEININSLIEKIADLESLLQEKTQYYNEREVKTNATIQQQTKLIDFLQSKIEEHNKKKKTLTDKLFGHSKKENLPPNIALNYKELELQLSKEKEASKNLQQEVFKLKAELYKKSESDLKFDAKKNLNLQNDILEQIVQSPQKNDLYRHNSVQRMHHNIPHRFDTKICTKLTKCAQCKNQVLLGRSMSVCRECNVVTHTNCANCLPRTCGLPSEYAKHYSDSLSRLNGHKSGGSSESSDEPEKVDIEGWIKIPTADGWTKRYACLTATSLNIYEDNPKNKRIEALSNFQLVPTNEHSKVILEPLPSEIHIPVAASDLPFVIKVEVSKNTTCWPPECIIFMTLSNDDKDKWFKGLQSILHTADKLDGEMLVELSDDLEINSLFELNAETKLLGTENGLYSFTKNTLLHILGPLKVYDIAILHSINLVLMIIDDARILISCDLNHLLNLTLCAPCIKPTLKFNVVNVNNMKNFHILRVCDFTYKKYVCVATAIQLVIIKYDSYKHELLPIRILDTAEPVSCILFSEHSIIIGADKFFEVDLQNFEADEFLDASDSKLSHIVKCFKLKSFPLAILNVSKSPVEYLACFHEFGVFVDEYGRSKRASDIQWSHLPKVFHLAKHYLYIIQFNAVEILKLRDESFNTDDSVEKIRLEIQNVQYLGGNEHGIYVCVGNQIRFINAISLDDNASVMTESIEQNEESNGDRFSFTSSMLQSLDGNLSDVESEADQRRVAFSTDL